MTGRRTRAREPGATACADYTFRQRFRVPVPNAYRWCLDFSPNDVAYSRAHLSRKVVWLSPHTVLLDDRFPGPGGRRVRKVKLVQIYPTTRTWVSTHIAGPNRLSQFRYRIVPDGRNASALVFEGRELRWEGPVLSPAAGRRLARRLRKEDSGLWKKYAVEMERDLTVR